MCRSCFVLQCGTARRPFPTIILQNSLLVSVNTGYLLFALSVLFFLNNNLKDFEMEERSFEELKYLISYPEGFHEDKKYR